MKASQVTGHKSNVKAGQHGKPMAGYKAENEKNVDFAVGGNTPMFGEQVAGSQKPAGTAHNVSDSEGAADTAGAGGSKGASFASGGKGKMFGYNPSVPAQAGITSAR